MKFKLEINRMDNAAFNDGMGGREEVARILDKAASRIADTDEGVLLDGNGNVVGSWAFTDEEG